MKQLRLLPRAEADIAEIATYIARDNPSAAERWVDAIRRSCERLAGMPGLGVSRDHLRKGLRMLPSGNYVILYRVGGETLDIVRVVHAKRDWQSLI